MSSISKPHDALFKRSLQHKQITVDWLVHHLPKGNISID
ncbi:MAG: Rpn family recombination-promoting nuclease/putative transposase [Candidatus Regiella insecticola]|nr:Rpn family recombination-promoting nuclease/putative transposase [Candidatus Regiella insecticola]